MGFGEVIGNRSVHWRVVHEEHGTPGPPERTPLKGTPAVQGAQNLTVLDFEAQGTDGVPFERIGRGWTGNPKGHGGSFRVELRFASKADADAALAAAKVIPPVPAAPGSGQPATAWVIVLDVPATNRTAANVGPPANPPAEVRIDW